MNKFLAILKISFQQETAYKLNFLLWRLRNLFQIFLLFFLWDSVFTDPDKQLFGYDRTKILTYVFGIIAIKAVVNSARATDVAGEISRGDLSKFLTKPINYINYWFVRDLSTKSLNFIFATLEVVVLYFLLKPQIFLQTNVLTLTTFSFTLIIAIGLFFILLMLSAMIAFWIPEAIWPTQYIIIAIFAELFSGAVFPIDILPNLYQKILYVTPFPYLLFFPLQVYLGKLSTYEVTIGILVSTFWLAALYFLLQKIWHKGLQVYRAEGD